MIPRYSISNDSITVIKDGATHTVLRGKPNYEALKSALFNEAWDTVDRFLSPAHAISKWADGRFSVKAGVVHFDSQQMPEELNNRLIAMADAGEDPRPLMRFWERLQNNPSNRSVTQLWRFLDNCGIPLTSDGHFLAYKGVREDFLDKYTGKISNKPGEVVSMARNLISDDPNQTCHYGLHVGALQYAQNFAPVVVICKVDPADVVCVPNDYSSQKMRVCRYVVVGLHNGDGLMPSTSIPDADVPSEGDEWEASDDYWQSSDCYNDDGDSYADGPQGPIFLNDQGPEPELPPPPKLSPNRRWRKYDEADAVQLNGFSLDDLRTYAANRLKIVGASRISGGKAALIKRILEVR